MDKVFWLGGLSVLALAASCATVPQHRAATHGQAMVAAANPYAVEAGLAILRDGGSAVDAAVAVQAMLSLVEPQSSGLGGGAFLVHYDAETKQVTAYDGRETAPLGARPDMFLGKDDTPLNFVEAVTSGHAVGVPGVVAMLEAAHKDHGSLAWSRLFVETIETAEGGFVVSPRLNGLLTRVDQFTPLSENTDTGAYFFPEGTALAVGETLRNPAYAHTLREISSDPERFYTGPIAAAIVASAQDLPRPGTISVGDLRSYTPRTTEAVCAPFRSYTVCSAQPPSSGGVIINQMLSLWERANPVPAGPDSARDWRVFVDAQRLAYADRDAYVADPAFVAVPVSGLLDAGYLDERAELISAETPLEKAFAGTPTGVAGLPGQDGTDEANGTSHFVVVDAQGDVVSMTTSVEFAFGSHRMAGGMILNNQLTDFSREIEDASGKPVANRIEPGKRPRSSMSPTIILDADGHFVMAVGSPGGNSIPAYTFKTIVGVLDWELSAQEAVDLPNVIARGDTIRIEEGEDGDRIRGWLNTAGYQVAPPRGEESGLHVVYVNAAGQLEGAADKRREGQARRP